MIPLLSLTGGIIIWNAFVRRDAPIAHLFESHRQQDIGKPGQLSKNQWEGTSSDFSKNLMDILKFISLTRDLIITSFW